MNLKIKAVQLDLARQKENIEFILSFIDFIKKYGFNTIVLYLEGRIKTNSFPYIKDEDSYSKEEMKEVVKYADKKGIDVIPVVSTLGHTELFLQFPQMRHLAELYGDTEGRWFDKGYYNMTCPLNEEVYKFFENYFSEVIPIFKSKYFHAGLDECWEIGMCEKCSKEGEKNGYDYLYSYHINRIYKTIKKFKKKMMMWDDMFEIYPEALENIPGDIIMCTWNYNYFVYKPTAHFSNFKREDVFKKYNRMGFKYLFCTRELLIPNIYSFTEYARKYKPLGGLITNWERSTRFQFDGYPPVAFAGKYWNSKGEDVENSVEKTMKEFADKNIVKKEGLKKYYFSEFPSYRFSPLFTRGEVEPLEEQFYREEKLLYSILNSGEKNEVIDEVVFTLKEKILIFEIRKFLYENLLKKDKGEIRKFIAEIDKLKKEKLKRWKIYRKNIPSKIVNHYNSIVENINAFLRNKEESNYFLTLRFFLPDMYGLPLLSIFVYGDKGEKKEIISKRPFKQVSPHISYYSFVFPFLMKQKISKVELSICGYGGQGISFLEVVDKEGNRFIPESIGGTSGIVENPCDLLEENLKWTYLGLREIKKMFKWNEARKIEHSIEINMKKDI